MRGCLETLRAAWSWIAPQLWLVCGLLVAAPGGPASAEGPELTPLLERSDLRGYSSGTMAPAFDGVALEGGRLSSVELRGRVIILNFWASWCVECRREMPALEQIYREFARRGLVVVGINVREDQEAIRRYVRTLSVTLPVVLDADGKINAAYGVVGLPTTFVVDRDGHAIGLAIGPREWANAPARDLIEVLLAEFSPRSGIR